MLHIKHKRNIAKSVLLTLTYLIVLLYLMYHILNGDRGLFAYMKLSKQNTDIKQDLDFVRAERLHLEHRVQLLRSDSLDLDLLDERARTLLGYAGKNEKVYMVD